MTAYLVVSIKIHDPSWLESYSANVPALVQKHGGAYLVVSETIRRVEGDGPDPDGIVLFTFPTTEAIDSFLSDPDYAALKVARLAGSSSDMFAVTPRARFNIAGGPALLASRLKSNQTPFVDIHDRLSAS